MTRAEGAPERNRQRAWQEHPVRHDLMQPQGKEHLLMKHDTDLRGFLLNLVEIQERQVLSNVLEFAEQEHRGQLRKDGKTEYIRHPQRVSVRTARGREQDRDVPLLKIAIAVVHDTKEDSTKTPDAFERNYYATLGQDRFTEQVLEGAYILNKFDESGKPKPIKEYYDSITKAGLWDVKGFDRLDSFLGDIALMETDGQTPALLKKTRKSYSKLQDVFPYVQLHAPEIAKEILDAMIFGAIFLTAHPEQSEVKNLTRATVAETQIYQKAG
jgi:hypothetical protein